MWPGTFNHHLDIILPGFLRQLAESFQLRELRCIAGIGETAGTQTVAERKAHVVLLKNLADGFEVFVEHILLVILHHPFGKNRAAAAHDPGDTLAGQRHVLHQHAGVNGHVIDTLLGLFFDHFEHDLNVQIFHAANAVQRFIDGHGANGHRRSVDDGFADARNIAAGGKIHHRIRAILHGICELIQFFVDVRRSGGISDVGVDLAFGRDADAHGLQAAVIDIGRNDHAAARHLLANQFRRETFALGDDTPSHP